MLATIAEEKGIVEEGKKNENMPKNCEYEIAAMMRLAFVNAVKIAMLLYSETRVTKDEAKCGAWK